MPDHRAFLPVKVSGAAPAVSHLPAVSFCGDPKIIGATFTPTYDERPSANFASVNAGAHSFTVGGGTLNAQFDKDLRATGRQQTEKYEAFHRKLFSMAEVDKFTAAPRDLVAASANLQAGFIRKAARDKIGCVFVDVFKPDKCVHGNPRNIGMVYAVGPRRQDCQNDAEFLMLVEAAGNNISRTCSDYNISVPQTGAPRIEILRVPLVSGGKFAGKCSKDDVATALVRGLICGSSSDAPEFNFAFDGNIFLKTWQSFKSGSLPISGAVRTSLPVARSPETGAYESPETGAYESENYVAAPSSSPGMRFSRVDSVTMISGDDFSRALSQKRLPTITDVLRLKQELNLPAPIANYKVVIGENEVPNDFPLNYDPRCDQGLNVVLVNINMPARAGAIAQQIQDALPFFTGQSYFRNTSNVHHNLMAALRTFEGNSGNLNAVVQSKYVPMQAGLETTDDLPIIEVFRRALAPSSKIYNDLQGNLEAMKGTKHPGHEHMFKALQEVDLFLKDLQLQR